MMATSHAFPPEESFPHPTPTNFQTQQNTKQAVIYNKSGTKCMNIVKEPGMSLSPTSPSTREQNDSSPSHNLQNNNGTAKKKKKKKVKRKPPADHVYEADIQANGTHNNHIKTHQVNYTSDDGEEVVDVELEDEDEFDSEDGYDPEDPEIPFPRKDSIAILDGENHHVPNTTSKKKKKKKKNKNGLNINQISDIHHNHPHHNHSHKSRKDGIWNTNNNEERQRIREFWLQLGEEERRSLVKVEKEAVLKKMKEQQKHSCSCSVCGKKRTAIEEELETLYDAYYEELESYANQQQQFGPSNIEYRNDTAEFDDEDDDEDYDDDDEDDDEDYEGSENDSDTRREIFNFGNSLTVKGGILTVADDLLKNDGKKFLEMMERLAERRMQREEEAAMEQRDYEEYEDDEDEEYEDEAEEDNQTDEQRMEEGRRMFQIFAARMFEQRVLNAYREKVAQERQQKLLEELEEENRLKEERELKKLKEKEKKKAKNRALKLQKEEERARKEAERLAEEKALRAERERKLEEERKKREEERLKKEAERRAREEERQRKEEEKRRKAKEDKEREERRKKEQEAKERKEREREEKERKEREEKFRKEKEERRQREERERKQRELKEKERKEKEEQERKDREKKEREAKERERKEKEEQERKDREEKDRKEREEKQRAASVPPVRQQQHHERKRTIPPIGQPSAQTPPPPPINSTVVHNKSSSMPNGMNWMNYSSHEHHPPLPPQHPINPQHVINSHLPPHPLPNTPHPLFSPGGPQSQFGGQPVGIMNGPTGMTNEVVNDVFTNNKKVINPPSQGTNTLQGINPTSSLFAGLGPIGMGVHPHHGGPPVPMHAHHQVMRQIPPPRGFNPIAPTPHLAGPSGVPPSVASTNLSLLNENTVMSGNGNIGTGVSGNPPTGAFGGLPIGGVQGSLGPQTFNLGTQVISQPPVSHMGSNVSQSTPLAPIGHRRMSQHPEDSHVKAIHRPQPIQRPRRNSGTGQSLDAHTNTRSPPPGFGNMVGSSALLGEDQPHPMVNRRQSLALVESSYFSNSLFCTAMPGESNPPQSSPNQQQQQHGTNRLSHRSVASENEWPPIRGRQNVTDNLIGESLSMNGGNNVGNNNIGSNDIWGSNYVGGQSLWYSEGNNPANRRAVGSRDFSIP